MSIRSTMPRNSASAPIGITTGTAFAPSSSRISSTTRSKSAPVRSILLMNAMRGTPYLSACRHTVSACGCTPPTAQKRATVPSRTRRLRSTSAVKSTWPGVSITLMRWSRQYVVVAADVIVMPRSCSWTIQSIFAAPSWTSPILCRLPVKKRIRSVTVVLPASMCAMIPTLRMRSMGVDVLTCVLPVPRPSAEHCFPGDPVDKIDPQEPNLLGAREFDMPTSRRRSGM